MLGLEIAEQLRAVAVLPEDTRSISSSHVIAHSSLQLQFREIQDFLLVSEGTSHTECSYIHNIYRQKYPYI